MRFGALTISLHLNKKIAVSSACQLTHLPFQAHSQPSTPSVQEMRCPPWKQVSWLYVRAGSIRDNLCRIVPGTLSLRCWIQHRLEVLLSFVESDYGTASQSPDIAYIATPHRRMQRSLPALGGQRNCPLQITALSLYSSTVVSCKNFFCMWHIYNFTFWKRKASREKSKPLSQLLGNIKTNKTCSRDLNHHKGINFEGRVHPSFLCIPSQARRWFLRGATHYCTWLLNQTSSKYQPPANSPEFACALKNMPAESMW